MFHDYTIDAIKDCLNDLYNQAEGQLMEHDITKEEFSQIEKESREIATLVGLESVYYPFKKTS